MVVAEAAAAALVCDLVILLVDDGVSIRTNPHFSDQEDDRKPKFLGQLMTETIRGEIYAKW